MIVKALIPTNHDKAIAGRIVPSVEHPRHKLLEALPANESAALRALGENVEFTSGALIASAKAEFTYVYFPEDSVFSFVTDLANGSSVESGTVGCEGFVGIPILLGGTGWPQRTIVQIPGSALKVPAAAFAKLLPTLPALSIMLNQYLLAYLAQVSQTAACNSQHTVLERCARWILLTQDRVGARVIPLTQEFLSYMLGVRRPSVTVAQAELKELGLLEYTRGKIVIVDREGLERISCECYGVVRNEFATLIGAPTG